MKKNVGTFLSTNAQWLNSLGEGTNNYFTVIFWSYNLNIAKSGVKSIFWIYLSIQRSVLKSITLVWLSLQFLGFRNGCFPI